jgi:hypothetical protein
MDFRQRIVPRKSFLLILITTITLYVAVACFAGEVNFIKVRGKTIGIGDSADQIFTILKNDDMVNQTVEKDPNNPNSLLVIKNYQIKGRKFTIYFARVHDPGPYKVTKIIEE